MSDARCPACAAAVRPGDPWCTLCYADLRRRQPEPLVSAGSVPQTQEQAAEAYVTPQPAPATPPAAIDPTDPLGLRPPMPRWTCPACSTTPTFDELVCPTCGHALLSDGEPALPSLIREDGKNLKLAVMLGGAAGLTCVLVLIFWLVGSLL